MSLIDLPKAPLRLQFHTLTVMPPHNVNRDEDGRPKTTQYGGATRGRISSQAKKRWIRYALCDSEQRAVRTREAGVEVFDLLSKAGLPEIDCVRAAIAVNIGLGAGDAASDLIKKIKPDEQGAREIIKAAAKTKSADAVDPSEAALAHELAEAGDEAARRRVVLRRKGVKSSQGLVVSTRERQLYLARTQELIDAFADGKNLSTTLDQWTTSVSGGLLTRAEIDLDIALFGRMVAANPGINTQAAASVGHMMTTHAFAVEGDYFSAGEELNALGETGAAITSYAFFGGGTYYQHAVLDIAHLAHTLSEDGRYGREGVRDLVGRGVRVMLDGLTKVQPRGKRNSFASDTMASFALMDAGTGPTFNLALAFLDPVRPGERAKADAPFSYADRDALTVSVERLRNFHAVAREAYGITDPACAFAGPGAPRAGNSPPEPRDGVGEVWTLAALHAFAESEVARWWAAA